ncbi:MAG: hypothetical protein ACI9U2_004497 [Bradymonadia bacterium]|jgi:hypothetical protein
MHSLTLTPSLRAAPLLLAACGGAPTLFDLGPDARAPVRHAFAAEPTTGYGCRAEDVPGFRDAPASLADVEFGADGRMRRFTGLNPKADDMIAMHAKPPRCVDGEIKLLRAAPLQAIVVPITLRYRADTQAGRARRFEPNGSQGGRCVIDIAFAAP